MGLFTNFVDNQMIRRYQMAIEAALSDLKVRSGNKLVEVPILSSSGERRTYETESEPNDLNFYPRSTVKFSTVQPDETRQINKNLRFHCRGNNTKSRPAVPQIFSFTYTAVTKKRYQAESICEQIIYAFSPFRTFFFKDLDSHMSPTGTRFSVAFRSIEDNYSSGDEPVSYTVELEFEVVGNFYGNDGSVENVIEQIFIDEDETADADDGRGNVWFDVK